MCQILGMDLINNNVLKKGSFIIAAFNYNFQYIKP